MSRKRHRHRGGIVGLLGDSYAKRLQSLEQDPGIERRQRGSGLADQLVDIVLDEFFRTQDDAAEAAALAVNMLCCGIDHAVGAEFERMLIERRRKNIVDHEGGTRLMRDIRDGLDVENVEGRVGWTFEKERLGVRP